MTIVCWTGLTFCMTLVILMFSSLFFPKLVKQSEISRVLELLSLHPWSLGADRGFHSPESADESSQMDILWMNWPLDLETTDAGRGGFLRWVLLQAEDI